MPSVFTRIIQGELPGRFVWKDDRCVVLMTINPLRAGHCMVIPREEVDHWVDLPPDLAGHLMEVARKVGKAMMQAFKPTKVGMVIVGLEVHHVHLHLVPIDAISDIDFAKAEKNPDPKALDAAAEQLRAALARSEYREVAR